MWLTKCESTVVNVLAPFTMQQISEELESVMYHMNLFILQIYKITYDF
jgi:hypothetical protein